MRIFIITALFIMISASTSLSMGSPPNITATIFDEKFDSIRHNTPKLITFLNRFPKGADLHNHVSGAAFVEYLLIQATNENYFYDLEKLEIIKDNVKNKNVIPVKELLKRQKDLRDYLNIVSKRGWYKNTANGSDHFFDTFSHIAFYNWQDQAVARIIARNYSQGVRYLELMSGVLNKKLINHLSTLLPKESFNLSNLNANYNVISEYLNGTEFKQTVNADMLRHLKAVDAILNKQYNITISGDNPDIIVKYLSQLARSTQPYNIFINAAAYMKASQIDTNIVATNMVQDEASIFSLMYFNDQMKVLDFLWTKLDKPNIALHAGELVLRESPVEPMRNRISQSIIKGHASRIGHGISIAWEKDVAATLQMMNKKDIAVEICLSSNDMILDVSGNDHPLALYLDANVPVTIATDDEGVSRSNLTMEYVRAAQEQNLSYSVLKQIAKNGLEYSFLEGDGIYDAKGKVLKQYQIFLTDALPNINKIGTKAYLQIRHERDLYTFEKKLFDKL